jgi:hypothetical protein
LPSAKTALADDRAVVRGFVDHLNGVLNRTVSKSRLTALRDKTVEHPRFDITRYVDGATHPIQLNGSSLLLRVQQKIEVVGERCQTVTYQYRLQRNGDRESWLVRWEFYRERPRVDYPYPLAHLHLNANLADSGEDVHGFHFPTRRVPIELVLWHLIVEWDVKPLSGDVLEDSIKGFEERQTVR